MASYKLHQRQILCYNAYYSKFIKGKLAKRIRIRMGKILLFYKYIDIAEPTKTVKWFRDLCSSLSLTGRIIIATEGINGTVGGSDASCQTFIETLNAHTLFGDIDFKDAPGDERYFPRMRIVIKNEIVHLGINPNELKASDGGKHLTPQEAHTLLSSEPQDLVVIDTRNDYEARIGTIPGAIIPDKKYFREFPEYVDEHLDELKNKQILMFCSGGVRCERASALIKQKGIAKEVYQIKGGIHRYIEQFPQGHFKGSYYVFDGRVSIKVSDDILSNCDLCSVPCDYYVNCMNATCNHQFIACPPCKTLYQDCCSSNCYDLVTKKKVPLRIKGIRVELNDSTPGNDE